MNGNGELTGTENVFYVSYGVLTKFLHTDKRYSYVLCYGYGNGYGNRYGMLEIRHKSSPFPASFPTAYLSSEQFLREAHVKLFLRNRMLCKLMRSPGDGNK